MSTPTPVHQRLLEQLAAAVAAGQYQSLETDTVEIKPVPADRASWNERYKSACAFLNTRGGILVLGVKEEQSAVGGRRFVHTGWHEHAEPKLRELPKAVSDIRGNPIPDIEQRFPPFQIEPFLGGHVALVLVDELPADQRYAFFHDKAWKRSGTGDVQITPAEIEAQEEFKREATQARELSPVPGVTPEVLDLDKLNDYILLLNKPVKVETVKSSLEDARSFLERKAFLKEGRVTTLGMLVCGRHPGDYLGFRCHVHGYVDIPESVAADKQDLVDNVLPLMEAAYGYVIRNIQVAVSVERGGSARPQYPDALLRETVNNALAHRDYSINRQVIIAIKPNREIAISNPGSFREHLLIEAHDDPVPLRRIIPEAKPRNPKLADVLRVYRKWEGRGIGMATLVDMALQNRIDLPFYRFQTEEVRLHLRAGSLVDERMKQLFKSYHLYISQRLGSRPLTEPQQCVLAYLIKSEWANEQMGYTIILTHDNNHFDELTTLEKAGLIHKHARSLPYYPIYVADRALLTRSYIAQLRGLFGNAIDGLKPLSQDVLNIIYRYTHFSGQTAVSAKQASFALWYGRERSHDDDIREFDRFYRGIRYVFNVLSKDGFIVKEEGSRGYRLNESRSREFLPM